MSDKLKPAGRLLAVTLMIASPVLAVPAMDTGLPTDHLQRAYSCIGILYAELALARTDVKGMKAMDDAVRKWNAEVVRHKGVVPDEGDSLPQIDAASAKYEADPTAGRQSLAYCLSARPHT
jgi:hypothetical protein